MARNPHRSPLPPHLLVGDIVAARTAQLAEPHVVALEQLRQPLLASGRQVPHFDPADGGDCARLLVLLETPGAGMDSAGFVSRDNPTGTARNLGRFRDEAGIARKAMVLWNSVPWVVHAPGARNRPLRRSEIAEGLALLPHLVRRLPALRVVLLAGRVAGGAAAIVAQTRPEVAILTMPHPSPTYVCTSPVVPERIRAAMAATRSALM